MTEPPTSTPNNTVGSRLAAMLEKHENIRTILLMSKHITYLHVEVTPDGKDMRGSEMSRL